VRVAVEERRGVRRRRVVVVGEEGILGERLCREKGG